MRKWQQLKHLSSGQRVQKQSQLEQEIERASIQQRLRLEQQPMFIQIPEQLPIAAHTEAIINALNQHQVLVIAGETGSGKPHNYPKSALKPVVASMVLSATHNPDDLLQAVWPNVLLKK